MKNILIIQQNLQGGGAEKVLLDIINNFDYTKYNITLLLVDGQGIYINHINNQVKVYSLLSTTEIKILGYLNKASLYLIIDWYLKQKITKLLRKRHYDTIISFMEGISAKCHGFICKNAKKNISWVHIDLMLNNWCKNQFRSRREQRAIYDKMDQIITVSDGARIAFEKLFPGLKADVIYNIIDKQKIHEKAKQNTTYKPIHFTVCNVGRLAIQKRQDRIIEVAYLCKINNLDIDFIILGDGPQKKQLEQLIKERELEQNVHLLGFQTNPYPYISQSNAFLLTSDSEGFPLVICESLCLGKPIISTDITGPHELLEDGTGILTSTNPVDIYDAIHKLYIDTELQTSYEEKSKAKSAIFDIEKQMNEIYQII